ncbi:MAG: D-alanine--D-alanine ligase [Propionibacteriaceae bacterium]|uniref:D-alanine--D-alanine ligase n=1 Tax=Propionibacterium ruminifibrarum TaxID=1962131 RepID=A0A375I200_9ACTN|nr:D-alanine--D-alanine ligase family protein [Propionibacterium ruminifibrarum]MBE6477058.1 D-alanine--D-alanine ligase [Propionibacteriaceae bacterium]SPF67678.1 D-Alanine-D-alanine ligase [Propionibacterium ruminifibrarum]
MSAPERIQIAVVFGGQSSEHQVSCLTAAGVLGAFDPSRYEVHGVGIDQQGVWRRYEADEIKAFRVEDGRLPSVSGDHPRAIMVRDLDGVRLATLEGDRMTESVRIDVAFPVMHGAYCEDGCIQGHFEILGLRYVGCGVASSANGMDKAFMRTCFEQAGVPLVPWVTITPGQWRDDRQGCLDRVNDALRYPVYVKPARGGSSVGISRVTDPAGLAEAIEVARSADPKVIVEQGVTGAREIECGVLGVTGAAPRASRPGEIVMHTADGFYDFDAKYLPEEQVELQVPADLPPEVTERVQAIAVACYEALDCEGLARVDVFVQPDGRVVVNEINTMPGFTPYSMYPSMWRATGIEYPDLVDALVDQALTRPATVLR